MNEAWGKWGDDDERGALNFIGEAEVARACGLVKHGRAMSLAQPLSRRMHVPPHRHGVMHFMDRDGGDYAAGARAVHGFQFADDTLLIPLHSGTHIDGLCHAWYGDLLYNGFPANSIRSTSGAAHCSVDKYPPIVTRGILLDVAGLNGGPLESGEPIGVGRLSSAAKHAGVEIEKGDAVLIRTGWQESQTGEISDFNREPGLDVDGALWLAQAEVALVGADNFAIEAMPFPEGTIFPVHQRLIRDYGIPLLEGLVLAPLAKTGAGAFLFVAAPLPVVGATGRTGGARDREHFGSRAGFERRHREGCGMRRVLP
jgi:kynurenine formamidase